MNRARLGQRQAVGLVRSIGARLRVRGAVRTATFRDDACEGSVTLKAPGSLPRSEGGKLQRVLDRHTLA
jgi:hypothetical protein